jgi:hypothetical protein
MIFIRREIIINNVQLFEVVLFSAGLEFVKEQVSSFQNSITMAISLLQMLIVLGALSSALSQLTIQLPALTGKYSLGTVALEVISPSTGRDLMTSFFYPMDSSCSEYPFSPVFPPLTLAYLLESVGISPNLPVNITTQAHLGAPISSTSFPLLFFSPGYGGSRLLYQAAAEDLASMSIVHFLNSVQNLSRIFSTTLFMHDDKQFLTALCRPRLHCHPSRPPTRLLLY